MKNILKVAITSLLISALVIFPEITVSSSSQALQTCINVLFPSLFPFFVLSDIFIKCGGADFLGCIFNFIMKPLFRINGGGASAFILGIISGYPVGAKTAVDLYDKGVVSKQEAENLICFCNNSGPLFIIGALGMGMLSSKKAGFFLLAVHILSSITLGILLRGSIPTSLKKARTYNYPKIYNNIFTTAVENSMMSVIRVFAYVIFFAIMMDICSSFNVFSIIENMLASIGISKQISDSLIYSVFEMTSGIKKLSASENALSVKLILSSFMLGWSGLSIIFQTKAVVQKINIRFSKYILSKLAHGIIASIYAYTGLKFFTFESETFLLQTSATATDILSSGTGIIFTCIIGIGYIISLARSEYKIPDSAQKRTTAR